MLFHFYSEVFADLILILSFDFFSSSKQISFFNLFSKINIDHLFWMWGGFHWSSVFIFDCFHYNFFVCSVWDHNFDRLSDREFILLF